MRAESERLRQEFLERSIDLSLSFAGFAEAKPQSALLRGACLRSARKGYHSVLTLMSKSSFSAEQREALQPRLDQLRAMIAADGNIPGPSWPPAENSNGHHTLDHALAGLTPRETEVLVWVARGYSTKQIAYLLGMSFKTAACHRYRIMDKLNIHDVATLVRYAIRAGLVGA